MTRLFVYRTLVWVLCALSSGSTGAASAGQSGRGTPPSAPAGSTPSVVPADYVIGPEDVLAIVFWGEKDLSAEVVVRPDGKISLPLLKDVPVAGYTPDQLTDVLVKAAAKYVAQPNATVVVKAVNSRKVFVVGQVARPGAFPLLRDTTVLQLIAQAGDVLEYAKAKNIVIVRKDGAAERRFRFNYRDVLKGKNIQQNIQLKPGDTVIVP